MAVRNYTDPLPLAGVLVTTTAKASPKGDGTDGLAIYTISVDASGNVVTGSNTALTPVAPGTATATNGLLIGGQYNSTDPTFTNGQQGSAQFGSRGALKVQLMSADGTAALGVAASSSDGVSTGTSTIITRALNYTFNGTAWDRSKKPISVARLPSSAATTNATSAKASAGDVFSINGTNASAGVIYLKLYNKATAPTVGTDTPFVTMALRASSAFEFSFPSLYMGTGIAYALTTGAADADNTAVGAGDILGLNIAYQ